MRRHAMALVVAAASIAGACGVASQDEARRADPKDVPFGLLAPTSTTLPPRGGAATSAVNVCLVRADAVMVVTRHIEPEPSVHSVIELVEAGPLSEPESSSGLRTEVPAGSVRDVELTGGVATVSLTRAFADVEADAQLLAIGQLVCTLTARPGTGQVRFTLDGTDIDVPRQDGSLTAEPVTRDDYRDLIANG